MRLWSIHPKYLDRQGLIAVWREALLAKKVLAGKTRGYKHHPQLDRFRSNNDPVKTIDYYLLAIWREALRRGYRFDRRKIGRRVRVEKIPVRRGQMKYEYHRLCGKIKARNPGLYRAAGKIVRIKPHPLFKTVPGPVEPWERMRY